MKETDYNAIAEEISSQLEEKDGDIVSLLGSERAIICVMGIYLSNNITCGYGQDFDVETGIVDNGHFGKFSVISSPNRISVVMAEGMSFYQSRETICGYESLEEDIANILVIIQAVIDRIYSNAV